MADTTKNMPVVETLVGSNVRVDMPVSTIYSLGSGTITPYLYICDQLNHRIQVTDFDGNPLFEFGSFGTGDGQFNSPYGVATNGVNVFVSDTLNHRVQVFDLLGNYVRQWGSLGSAYGLFDSPKGIAADNRFCYVVDQANNRFQVFNHLGVLFMSLGEFGSGDNQFNSPTNIYVDAQYIYIDDTGNSRVVRYELSSDEDYIDTSFKPLEFEFTMSVNMLDIDTSFAPLEYEFSMSIDEQMSVDTSFKRLETTFENLVVVEMSVDASFKPLEYSMTSEVALVMSVDTSFKPLEYETEMLLSVEMSVDTTFPPMKFDFMMAVGAAAVFHTIVMNVLNKSLSEYSGWEFNSFTEFSGKQLGFNEDGIYELTGDDDAGVDIDASFITKTFDLEEEGSRKTPYDVRLLGSFPGEGILIFHGEKNTSISYPLSGNNGVTTTRTVRQKLGKGLKDRTFNLEYQNVEGADFDISEELVNAESVGREMKG